jgi:hypothetical protein
MATRESSTAARDLASVGEWCAHHGLIGALLPFEYRQTESFGQFEHLAEELAQLPKTQATFKISELLGDSTVQRAFASNEVVTTHLRLLGAWPYTETSTGTRWINPNYCHDHPFHESQCTADERAAICQEAARLGALRVPDVAPRFGIKPESLRRWINRHEFPWSEYRRAGVRRLGRTLLTVREWTDRSERDVAAPFPLTSKTVESYIQTIRHEFEPPADPTNRSGWKGVVPDA